jgi:hypothetical protein
VFEYAETKNRKEERMGRSSNRPPKSKKLTRSRPSAIEEVGILVRFADTLDEVTKIVTGQITRGRSGPPSVRYEEAATHLKVTVTGNNRRQEFFVYAGNAEGVLAVRQALRYQWHKKIAS